MPDRVGLSERSDERMVWCVWTENGEYEQFSRDLRGVFATEDLARQHAEQIKGENDQTEVIAEPVADALPTRVPYIQWSAHIFPDGTVDRQLGHHHGRQFDTWSNELAPLAFGRIDPWHRPNPDLYIEAVGSDPELVKAEYQRLLAVASEQLKGTTDA